MSAPALVVKVGGATLEDATTGPLVLDAIAAAARRQPVVMVHGGGRAVDRQLARLGMETRRHEGLRITPPEQVEQIVGVLRGSENVRLVGGLLARGCGAVGLCLGDGGCVPTRKIEVGGGVEIGLVGAVAWPEGEGDGRGGLLGTLVRAGFVPVVCSIGIEAEAGGMGGGGGPRALNVNADDAAAGAAQALVRDGVGVSALVLLTDVPGVLDAERRVIAELDGAAIARLVDAGVVTGGMLVKVRAAHATACAIGTPVVIASGSDAGSLAQLGSGAPVGTRVVPK
jgi:acetylglutamate kinase